MSKFRDVNISSIASTLWIVLLCTVIVLDIIVFMSFGLLLWIILWVVSKSVDLFVVLIKVFRGAI